MDNFVFTFSGIKLTVTSLESFINLSFWSVVNFNPTFHGIEIPSPDDLNYTGNGTYNSFPKTTAKISISSFYSLLSYSKDRRSHAHTHTHKYTICHIDSWII